MRCADTEVNVTTFRHGLTRVAANLKRELTFQEQALYIKSREG